MTSSVLVVVAGRPTWTNFGGLLGIVVTANQTGFRAGRRGRASDQSRTVSGAIRASVFGLVALLLGHSSGQTDHRHLGLWVTSNSVFALVLFVVLEFGHP